MARNLYLAIIILFVIGFLYIIKNARHDINKTLYKPYDKSIDLKSIIGLGIADYD